MEIMPAGKPLQLVTCIGHGMLKCGCIQAALEIQMQGLERLAQELGGEPAHPCA